MNGGDGAHEGFLFTYGRECVHGTFPTCSNYVFDQCPRHHQTVGEMRGKEEHSGTTSECTDGSGWAMDTAVAVGAEHRLPGQVPM